MHIIRATLLGCLLTNSLPLVAGDWPQILGPHRNGKADAERIVDRLPAQPAVLWQRPVGSGYAGVAVAGGKVIVWHRLQGEAVAEALDAKTGKALWRTAFATQYSSQIAADDGPRCVPLISGESVYLMGAGGDLHCLAVTTGKEIWSRQTYKEFAAPEGYFGAGSTPIAIGGKVLVNVGGREGAGIVAFDSVTGKTAWKATDEAASYSSPVATKLKGKEQAIFVTRLNVVSIDPATGQALFRFPFGMRGPTVNAATPLVIDNHLFVTASYGIGARWTDLSGEQPRVLWENDEAMSSQYSTAIEVGGYLYGLDGRQDGPPARLRCLQLSTGKVLWTQDGFGVGNLILADGKLLIMKIDGEFVLVEPSSEAYRPLGQARLLDSTTQPLPALAEGLLYVRDTQTLKCVDLRK